MNDVVTMVQEELKGISNSYGELSQRLTELEQLSVRARGHGYGQKKINPLSEIMDSQKLTELLKRDVKSISIPGEMSLKMMRKSVVGDAASSENTLYPIEAERSPVVGENSQRRLSLLDVLPTIPVSSGKYEFIKLDTFVNGADYQEYQGDLKAEQAIDMELSTSEIVTIAVTLPVAEQVLADSPSFGQFLQAKLTYGVLEKLERELVAGAGTTGKVSGLNAEATTFTPTSNATGAEAIGEALTRLDVIGYSGNLVLLHPNDWHTIRSERSSTSDEYIASGWNSPAGANIWGAPVVTSAALSEGTAIVLDQTQVAVLDRMTPRYEFGYSDTGFVQNIATARAELRGGLAVFSPSSVLKFSI